MSSSHSVTRLLDQVKVGDAQALQPLWERFFPRLVQLARKRLLDRPAGAADEEDAALSAFHSFFKRAKDGRFPRLEDRDDLWRLLVAITKAKALAQVVHEDAQKRGGGKKRADPDWHQVLSEEPTPAFAAQVAEECQRLFDKLVDPQLRQIADWKMAGYTNEEIAKELGCVVRTVERMLRMIRTLWSTEVEP